MATPSVSTFHQSGGMTSVDYKPDRVSAKIGQGETGVANQIYFINNPNMAKDIFGQGEIVEHVQQYFEEFDQSIGQQPAPLLCVRPNNDTPGSVDAPVADPANTGSAALPTTSGTPTGSRTVILKIVKNGAHQTAEYQKSTDGGLTYGSPVVTPASNSPISLDVGVNATFVDALTPADTFKVGDIFTIVIKGPTASTAAKLTAFAALIQEYRANWIHLIGGVDRATAVSVNQILADMEATKNQPIFAILEARPRLATGETVAQYMAYLQAEFGPFYSERVSFVTAEGRYIAGGVAAAGGTETVKASGTGVWRNAATMLSAKLAAAQTNESPGWVQRFKSLTFSEIRYWKEGYQDYMDVLDTMRLTVLKQYNNFDGIFIAAGRIKSAPDSDFAEIPERRRADKMHRIVYQTSLPFLGADTELESGSGGIDYLKVKVMAKVSEEMMKPGEAEISKGEVIFDPNKTFAQTKILQAKMKMYVKNRIKAIEWITNFVNATK
jgi:hypothetical protein